MKVLITGAASGIGLEVANKLFLKGHEVIITTHTIKQANLLRKKINKKFKIMKLDITKESDRKKVKNLNIDVLVNHAGIGMGGSISEIPMEKVRENFEVNVFSSFELMQIVLKQMINKGSGKIFITSSLLGIVPMRFLGVYSATKASIISLATALRSELKLIKSNINISLIEPGAYHTGFNQVMLENKYSWMEKKSYFKEYLDEIREKENKIFKFIEKKNLDSITNKIVEAVESENPKFIIRAPILQVIGIKLYAFFTK